MREAIISIIFYVITFIISFILFMIIKRKLIKNKMGYQFIGVEYLVNKFNLNKAKIDIGKFITKLSLINSAIIAFVSIIIYLVPLKLFFQLGIGFILLIILIYAIYEIYGRYLNKKWGKKK